VREKQRRRAGAIGDRVRSEGFQRRVRALQTPEPSESGDSVGGRLATGPPLAYVPTTARAKELWTRSRSPDGSLVTTLGRRPPVRSARRSASKEDEGEDDEEEGEEEEEATDEAGTARSVSFAEAPTVEGASTDANGNVPRLSMPAKAPRGTKTTPLSARADLPADGRSATLETCHMEPTMPLSARPDLPSRRRRQPPKQEPIPNGGAAPAADMTRGAGSLTEPFLDTADAAGAAGADPAALAQASFVSTVSSESGGKAKLPAGSGRAAADASPRRAKRGSVSDVEPTKFASGRSSESAAASKLDNLLSK
jgi:hypothetical protein